ncbi:MAG TPA: hypothetical protein PLU94_05500 [Methanoregulaceae archaeon]|nr:hypothetical protein [Methanoregulaceae archaeon]HPH34929.1 hypothetical protein [Methanoregulaceae archaeon]
MPPDSELAEQIQKILRHKPKGMTITELALVIGGIPFKIVYWATDLLYT